MAHRHHPAHGPASACRSGSLPACTLTLTRRGRLLDLRLAVVQAGQGVRHPGKVSSVANLDLDHVAAQALLELAWRPGCDHAAVIDDDDVAGQVIGLV